MSGNRVVGALVAAMLAVPSGVLAGDANSVPAADEAFLEYLGSWDGDDEDWLVAEAAGPLPADDLRPPPDPAPAPGTGGSRGASRREPPKEDSR